MKNKFLTKVSGVTGILASPPSKYAKLHARKWCQIFDFSNFFFSYNDSYSSKFTYKCFKIGSGGVKKVKIIILYYFYELPVPLENNLRKKEKRFCFPSDKSHVTKEKNLRLPKRICHARSWSIGTH